MNRLSRFLDWYLFTSSNLDENGYLRNSVFILKVLVPIIAISVVYAVAIISVASR